MPIYEYECAKCGVMEVTQRITEDALTKCPQCKRRKVKKLISHTSFQLKGTGWYVTDYGGKKTSEPGESSQSTTKVESGGESSGESKTESKPTKESAGKKKSSKKAA